MFHSPSAQSSICWKETFLSRPMLIRAPAPPCMEYVNVGALPTRHQYPSDTQQRFLKTLTIQDL